MAQKLKLSPELLATYIRDKLADRRGRVRIHFEVPLLKACGERGENTVTLSAKQAKKWFFQPWYWDAPGFSESLMIGEERYTKDVKVHILFADGELGGEEFRNWMNVAFAEHHVSTLDEGNFDVEMDLVIDSYDVMLHAI